MTPIDLDANASTLLLPEAWEAMRPYFCDHAGNPASSHALGRHARQALESAREQIAALLDAAPDEVIFTSGATEANNLALLGLAPPAPGAIVSSALEHPCVVEPLRRLAGQGYTEVALPLTHTGHIDLERATFPADTRLVSVMLANHETGCVQPIAALVERLAQRAPFHCDAAAAVGKLPVSFRQLGVTALTLSGHKFHGPKGIGALVLRHGTRLRPLHFGGHQQQGLRPGTEAVPLAVGMATALVWCVARLEQHHAHVAQLRRVLLETLRAQAAPVVVNGENSPSEPFEPDTPPHPQPLSPVLGGEGGGGLPHTLNLSFPGCQADTLLMNLDLAGVACSTGSACSSGSLLPSPVLAALGLPDAVLRSALRFSLSPLLTNATVEEAARRIAHVVNTLRHCTADEV